MIKAILFDMDGVLIDSREWHYEALNAALELFGYTIGREAHLSTFDGLPTRRKLAMLTETRNLPIGLHEFLNLLKQSYTLEISYRRCKPVYYHQYALSRLRRDGYRMAVCSNSVRSSVETMMRLAGLDDYLDLTVSNEDVIRSKPDPEMYAGAIRSLGLKPDECLILEDGESGIRAAKASGAHLLVVRTPDDVTYQNISNRIAEIAGV